MDEGLMNPRSLSERGGLVVGLGGTSREGSSTEVALRTAGKMVTEAGARFELLDGLELGRLPIFREEFLSEPPSAADPLVKAIRNADGVVIGTPAYHGGVSGAIKNALDYLELLREDQRPYLSCRPVGCIVTGSGWKGAAMTLASLRAIVHSLRGWPTPMGVVINTGSPIWSAAGLDSADAEARHQSSLRIMTTEVVGLLSLMAIDGEQMRGQQS